MFMPPQLQQTLYDMKMGNGVAPVGQMPQVSQGGFTGQPTGPIQPPSNLGTVQQTPGISAQVSQPMYPQKQPSSIGPMNPQPGMSAQVTPPQDPYQKMGNSFGPMNQTPGINASVSPSAEQQGPFHGLREAMMRRHQGPRRQRGHYR